jgi:23S rRNA pseudouridine955/2504/2580 synthase
VLERFDGCTLVQASPVTGRTHQIRVHTQCKGHPIACDDKYGDQVFDSRMREMGLSRLFLHAYDLRFLHPKHETTMHVEAPLDKALNNALKTLRAK